MRLSKTSKLIVITLAVVVLLTGCGLPTGNERPDDKKLREGILLLMTSYERYHSEVINFDKTKVKAQISKKLPAGEATQAGWSIKWSNYITGELPSVVIPWVILGQYPQTFKMLILVDTQFRKQSHRRLQSSKNLKMNSSQQL